MWWLKKKKKKKKKKKSFVRYSCVPHMVKDQGIITIKRVISKGVVESQWLNEIGLISLIAYQPWRII